MTFECPISGCEKELNKLQYQHFNFKHDTTPREAIIELHGDEIRRKYQSGLGVYRLADSFDESYMTKEMVDGVVLKTVCNDCHLEIHRNMDQTMIIENQITLYSEVLT